MKSCFVFFLSIILFFGASIAFAGDDCYIPKDIKEGVSISHEFVGHPMKIIEIDKKTCWMKMENGMWVNISALHYFEVEK